MLRRLCVPLSLVVLFGGLATQARADLFAYVKRPEPAFAWKLKETIDHPAGKIYDLHLVSQTWQGIVWEHALQVYQPRGVEPRATMVLWNQGGRPSPGSILFGMTLAQKANAPVAFLYGVPNQPLLDGKKEDTLIAETFVRYLETKDENWPLLFPMVKSVVKAMDALQAFSQEQWKLPIKDFLVTGASKRGWTSWLTGVAEPRVKAIAPLVIDTLNFQRQLPHQVDSFGVYSEQIGDYTARGLVPMPKTPEARKLWSMVDPYVYRDHLKMPKLVINGNNDQYWTVDALNLFWNEMPDNKWITYVPNAGHNLEQKDAAGKPDRSRVTNSLGAFARHIIQDKPMPKLTWEFAQKGNKHALTVQSSAAPQSARLWVADSPTRDFRKATWVEQPAEVDGQKIRGVVEAPATGYRAFYADLTFDKGNLAHNLSTQLEVVNSGGVVTPKPPERE